MALCKQQNVAKLNVSKIADWGHQGRSRFTQPILQRNHGFPRIDGDAVLARGIDGVKMKLALALPLEDPVDR